MFFVKDLNSKLLFCHNKLDDQDYRTNYKKAKFNVNYDALSRVEYYMKDAGGISEETEQTIQKLFRNARNRLGIDVNFQNVT